MPASDWGIARLMQMDIINNPITKTDYPDPDVIRVGNVYYMISTTMYYMPGGVILRSYDLVNWEIASYVFESLDNTESERLEGIQNNYGKGMWAASLRYHKGKFYVAFVSHGRNNTHLFVADNIEGPWEHRYIDEYFHDCSLLFDNDRVFIVSGNTEIRLTELNEDLSGIKEGGIDRIIIRDNPDDVILGYEGAHFYRINDKYYIFLIHWPKYNGRRTEAVFVSDTIDGEYAGRDVMSDDMDYHNMGIAQGGIVDTPEGDYYSILFQDSGSVGRVPVLVPVKWENDFPVFGNNGIIPKYIDVKSNNPGYEYESLFTSDDFSDAKIKKQWQWNHAPTEGLYDISDGCFRIRTGKITVNPLFANNTLTQRMCYPKCSGSVTVDAKGLNNGDTAGILVVLGYFLMLGICKENDRYYIVQIVRSELPDSFAIGCNDVNPGEVIYKEELLSSRATIKITADFEDMKDSMKCYIEESEGKWLEVGQEHRTRFRLDLFTGARFGLCVFSEKVTGGEAEFSDFVYNFN